MRARLGGPLLAFAVALLPSCGLTSTFGDFDTSPGRYRVTGTVEGLGDAKVTLLVNGTRPGTIVSDGAFTTDAIVEGGSPYVVSVEAVPDGHVCRVENGTGVITTSDATNIAVRCPSTNAALTSLIASVGPLTPTFSPSVLDYSIGPVRTSLLAPLATTTVTATAARGDASIRIRGNPVANGVASPPIPIHLGKNLIDVHVTPAAVESPERTYALAIEGTGVADFFKSPKPFSLSSFGASVATSGDTLAIGQNVGLVFIYSKEGSGWSSPTELAFPTPEEGGSVVSLALDGDTLVVGAPLDAATATSAGAAFVYVRTPKGWQRQAKITATTPRAYELFGFSVALSGNTLVVGAFRDSSAAKGINQPHADTNAPSSGAFYVFERSGETWAETTYVKASNAKADSFFGYRVAIDGDLIAATAFAESSIAPSSGAAYVFGREGGVWSERAFLKAPVPDASSSFGISVAVSSTAVVVGSERESGLAGAAYVYAPSGSTYVARAQLRPKFPRSGNLFGSAVAISGDVLAVGSSGESSSATLVDGDQSDTSSPSSGAVYLYSLGDLSERAFLKAPEPHSAASFGGSLSMSKTLLVVGAPNDSTAAPGATPGPFMRRNSGAAYAFE